MTGATEVADIAGVAAAIGDPSRARVLLALAGGSALPASALAAEAGVSASTVSGHLSRLLAAKLLTVERDGRHRYYRLATPEVATALEWLSRIAQPLPVRSLRQSTRAAALLRARFCYDHLAGRLGVAVMAALLDREVLTAELADSDDVVRYLVTPAGQVELAGFGVDLSSLARRRPTVRYCLDWAEQRPHLAGPLGGALAARLFELDWIRRGHSRRVVHVTDYGEAGLRDTFGITAD
ncbi:ArsR/SmtB family transcription factor [Pseudonocardia sp. Cha107L01]|uniref:ArsR/SmtB family transcription factor n=1 Tax=Pseudonocardia sp. Cha107L01 TaxID=3457576 RepID=UPI00403EF68F